MYVYVNVRNGQVAERERRCPRRDGMRNWMLVSAPPDDRRLTRRARKAIALAGLDEPAALPPDPPAGPDEDPGVEAPERPAGNASRDAWAAYAAAHGHEITDDMTRNAIRGLCG